MLFVPALCTTSFSGISLKYKFRSISYMQFLPCFLIELLLHGRLHFAKNDDLGLEALQNVLVRIIAFI